MTWNLRNIFLIILGLVCIAAGCFNPFAPGLGDISSENSLPLTDQTNFEDVLVNFRYAYTYKDSIVYRNVLADDFQFIFRDHDNDTYVSWGKEVDIKTTVGVFGAFNVISLVWKSTNYMTYAPDSTEVEISKGFILTLDSTIRITGDAVFTIKPFPDGIWRITRWEDKSIM
jgi:hypothetical protein